MTESELQSLAGRAFRALGVPAGDAEDTARILVLGDLLGHHTHGVSRVESYGERLRLGGIAARPCLEVEEAGAAMVRVDGGNALGPVVGMRALREAGARARRHGVGVAFARGSNHFGAVGPYCWLAAQEGCASFICSNATPTIAPTGGREARLGNSPLGFGIPNPGDEPVILDMALSVVARAKIREALKASRPIPDSWATDREGRPTTDPREALDGFLAPIGGYKGYGLALVVDLLAGVLSGAAYLTRVKSWSDEPEAPQDLGHFFLLLDATRLGPPEALAARLADFAAILHGTPPSEPGQPVMLPGEREMASLARQRARGMEVDPAVVAALEALATRS